MRLWFNVTTLLILACIILEASAAKSNRATADNTKDNYKSTNSKEVRYAKTKNSNYKKKGNGREEEVIKERKQRHKIEETQNTDYSNEILEKTENQRSGRVTHEEQKKRKPNEHSKYDKNEGNVKVDKNKIEEHKGAVKKHKRSSEIEYSAQESSVHDAGCEDSKINLVSRKEKSKNKINKKTDHDAERNGNAVVNNDQVADDKSSEETSPPVNENDSGWKKKKIVKDQQGNSKKIKRQVRVDSAELSRKNGSPKKRDSTRKEVQRPKRSIDTGMDNGKDSILINESNYYLNEDGIIQEKKSGGANGKKYKSSEISPVTASDCKNSKNRCKISASDTQRHEKRKLKGHRSNVCNLKFEDSVKEDEIHNEKFENSEDDTPGSGTVDLEQEEDEDEDTTDMDMKLAEDNELEDETAEGEHCVKEE